jgi:hypothetical protein
MLNLAKWWGVDPDVVKRWTMIDFADREEYMMVQIDVDNPKPGNDSLAPDETEWTGR